MSAHLRRQHRVSPQSLQDTIIRCGRDEAPQWAVRVDVVIEQFRPIPLKKPSDFERGCELRLSFDGCDRFHPGFSSCDWCRWLELCQFPEVLGGGCEGKFVLNAIWAA